MAVAVPQLTVAFEQGELIDLPFAVLSSQYANGATFDYKFQMTDPETGAAVLSVTGNATVADGKFSVPLSTAETNQAAGDYPFSLRNTTNNRTLAKGVVVVEPGQV